MPDEWKLLSCFAFRGSEVTKGLGIFNSVSLKICLRLTIWLLEGIHVCCFVSGRILAPLVNADKCE